MWWFSVLETVAFANKKPAPGTLQSTCFQKHNNFFMHMSCKFNVTRMSHTRMFTNPEIYFHIIVMEMSVHSMSMLVPCRDQMKWMSSVSHLHATCMHFGSDHFLWKHPSANSLFPDKKPLVQQQTFCIHPFCFRVSCGANETGISFSWRLHASFM